MQLTKCFDSPNLKLLLKKVCVCVYAFIYIDSVTENSFCAHTHVHTITYTNI